MATNLGSDQKNLLNRVRRVSHLHLVSVEDDSEQASPFQPKAAFKLVPVQSYGRSFSGPMDFHSLTARRRDFVLSQPLRNPKTQEPFHRALIRLRGFFLWQRMLTEIEIYGTGSCLLDQFGMYKECLPSVMRGKIRTAVDLDLSTVKVSLGRLFHPMARFKHYWSFLIVILLLYSFLFVPYLIAFVDGKTFWDEVDLAVDLLFLLDICFTLNTAILTPAGDMITDRWLIFKSYLHGMLILDIVSILPFDYMSSDYGGTNNLVRFLRLAKFTRLFRASKLMRLLKLFKNSESMKKCADFIQMYSGITRLVTTLNLVVILVHLISCMWYFSAKMSEFSPDTWVVRRGIQDADSFTLYLTSFYWAITTLTTVGFGDISAKTSVEMILAMCWMLFGVGFYSFIVGTLSSVLTSLDAKAMMVNAKLQVVELFAKDSNLHGEIVGKMTKEVKNTCETITLDESQRQAILSQFPKSLRLQIAKRVFNGVARKIVFFTEIESACLAYIVPLLYQRMVSAGSVVYSKGDYADEVYFLVSGRLSYVYGKRNITFKSIVAGAYCGEIELIDLKPREFGMMTAHDSDMLVMSKSLFETMMREFPTVSEKVKETAIIRRKKNLESLKEVLDVLEAVEIRRENTIQGLAGQAKVEFEDETKEKEEEEKPVTVVMNACICKTEEEIATELQSELTNLNSELTVSVRQEIKAISEAVLVKIMPRTESGGNY